MQRGRKGCWRRQEEPYLILIGSGRKPCVAFSFWRVQLAWLVWKKHVKVNGRLRPSPAAPWWGRGLALLHGAVLSPADSHAPCKACRVPWLCPSWGPAARLSTQSYSLSTRLINLSMNPCLSVSPCLVLYAPPSKEAFLFSWGEGGVSALAGSCGLSEPPGHRLTLPRWAREGTEVRHGVGTGGVLGAGGNGTAGSLWLENVLSFVL